MRATVRDAIAIALLLVAAVAVRLAWHPLGPWVSLGIAFGAALAVTAVYRMRPTAGPPDVPSSDQAEPALREPVLLRQD